MLKVARHRLEATVLERFNSAFGATKHLGNFLHRHLLQKTHLNNLALVIRQAIDRVMDFLTVELHINRAFRAVAHAVPVFQGQLCAGTTAT